MNAAVNLPNWPSGTVAILVTGGDRPHAIPVSAALRAGPARILLGLARGRGSLARLRADPRVTVAICASDAAFSADGTASVAAEQLTANTVAVAVEVDTLHDHRRPTFAIDDGVRWHWTDDDAAAADDEVRAALRGLVG
jgi:hypothetical protein